MSLLRNLGHKNRVEKPPEPPVATKPDENLIQNAIKLAAEIDLSQLSTLQKAIDNLNGYDMSSIRWKTDFLELRPRALKIPKFYTQIF